MDWYLYLGIGAGLFVAFMAAGAVHDWWMVRPQSKIQQALAVATRRAQTWADIGNASKDEADRKISFHRANEAKEIADEVRSILRARRHA
jgi:Flp pilus assembly protein TadG